MAGSAYKGLTIRIGADTTKLSTALRGIDSAAFRTQRELRKLNQASAFDPKNTKIASAQIGAMASEAVAAAAKITVLKQSVEEVGAQKTRNDPTKTISDLAKETDNAALAAAQATARYNALNAALEPAFAEIKKNLHIDLRKETNAGNFEKAFDEVKKKAADTGKVSQETITKVESLKKVWIEAFNGMEDAKLVESLHNAKVDAQLAEVEVSRLARSMAELNTRSQFSGNFKAMVSEMGLLGAAAEAVSHRLSRIQEASHLDPSNIDLAREKASALADAIQIAEKQSALLNKQILEYKDEGYEQKAAELGNVAEALVRTKRAYEDSEANLAKYQARLDTAKETLQRFRDADDGSEKAAENIRNQEQAVADLQQAYDKAAASRDKASGDYDTAKACNELDKLKVRLIENDTYLNKLRNSFGGIRFQSGVSLQVGTLAEDLKVISAGAETARSRFDALNRAAQLKPYSIGIAVQKTRAFVEATGAAREKAANLRKQLEAYKSNGIYEIAKKTDDAAIAFERANKNVDDLTRALEKEKKESGEASDKARELGEKLNQALREANTAAAVNECKKLQTALTSTKAEVQELKNAMKVSFDEVGTAAVNAAQQVAQLAQQLGSSVIDSSRTVDASYRDLTKTFDASEAEYKELYDAAMKYSQTNVTSADKMLEMESIAAQLGVGLDKAGHKTADATEQIRRFAEVGANLDVATNIDAETIALQMGQIQNVMDDLSPDNIESFGDALVRLGNTMPTQESNIMQITQRLTAVGSVANFTTPELMGWAAAIASTGQRSEAAATGISNTITAIQKAVGKGGDSLELFAKTAGKSAQDFADEWKKDPTEALKAFLDGLDDLEEESLQRLEDLDITGVRQTQTLLALAKTVDTVDGAINNAEEAWNGGGDALTEATKKAAGFSGAMSRMENSGQVLAASFSEAMVPVIELAGEKLRWLTDIVNSWSDETKRKIIVGAAAFTAFATIEPIIVALGGNLIKLVTGGLKLFIQTAGFIAGGGLTASIASGFETVQIAALLAADGMTGLMAAIGGFITAGTAFPVILGGLGAVVVGSYLVPLLKAHGESKKFNETIGNINGSTEGLSRQLLLGSDDIDGYGTSWKDAKVNMDKFFESMNEHSSNIKDIRNEAGASISQLERYQQIIDGAAGKGEEYAGSQLELKNAIEGVNEILGTSLTVEDVLKGTYEDEAGAVKDLREEIDKLIESKQREIRVNALEDIYGEAVKAQAEAQIAYDKAKKARRDYVKEYREEHKDDLVVDRTTGETRTYTKDELTALARGTAEYKELAQAVDETKVSLRECNEEVETSDQLWQSAMDESAYRDPDKYGQREGFIMTTEAMTDAIAKYTDWGETLEEMRPKVKDFAQSLQDAGVGSKDFMEMSSDTFTSLLQESGGDIEKMTELVKNWNRERLEKKYAIVEWDGDEAFITAEGERYEWNNNEWAPAKIDVDTSEVTEKTEEAKQEVEDVEATQTIEGDNEPAKEAVDEVVDYASKQEAEVTVTAAQTETETVNNVTTNTTANVTTNIDYKSLDDFNSKLDEIDRKKVSPTVGANTSSGKKNVDTLRTELAQMTKKSWVANVSTSVYADNFFDLVRKLNEYNGKRFSATVTTYQNTVKGSAGNNARGGYVPDNRIPRHADGAIFTRPTLTQYGWVGEDGAELYSGGNLVPLTNRKYSMPYIDDISDAVAKKLGPVSSGNQISVTVNGVSSPDDVADAIYRKLSLFDI